MWQIGELAWFVAHFTPYSEFCTVYLQCSHCENPGLLFAGLKRAGHIEADLDINMMIREALAGESDMEEDFLSQMSILQTGESKDKVVFMRKTGGYPALRLRRPGQQYQRS